MATALIIYPDNSVELREVEPDLFTLQALVAGYVEAIMSRRSPRWIAYLNEDGKLLPLPPNPLATEVALKNSCRLMRGDVLAGTVVFLGMDAQDEHCDVPQALKEAVHGLAAI